MDRLEELFDEIRTEFESKDERIEDLELKVDKLENEEGESEVAFMDKVKRIAQLIKSDRLILVDPSYQLEVREFLAAVKGV